MKTFYIYSFDQPEGKRTVSTTVIFCPSIKVDIDKLQDELKEFYKNAYQTERTFFIGGSYITDLANLIVENKEKLLRHVPTVESKAFYNNLHVLTFNEKGEIFEEKHANLKKCKGLQKFKETFLQAGMQQIFIDNEGLIAATGSHHHFVFPSGKHSDRFIRVANILIHGSEIYFIAFGLLRFFDKDIFKYIYCDTSSINSVAFALIDLVKRFDADDKLKHYAVESFGSYEGLYNSALNLQPNAFIIISASTSGGMLDYILETHQQVSSSNISILYFLRNKKPSKVTMERALCDLTQTDNNKSGIECYPTYTVEECPLCKDNSFAVEVSGDVFLLEKPLINSVRITAEDMDLSIISKFVNQFMSVNHNSSILKVNYKDNIDASPKSYDLYIDFLHLIQEINKPRLQKFKSKLDAYIDQHIPSNTKHLLYLNDLSSKHLSEYILQRIVQNYAESAKPTLITQSDVSNISKDLTGSIVIVASCISNGKNLLYLSRALRDHNLRIIYFIGINRSNNTETYSFLKSNLKYGAYGSENSSFVEIEKIHCSNLSIENSWQLEKEFLKKHISIVDDETVLQFLKNRLKDIESSESKDICGLSNKVFLPRIDAIGKRQQLRIRRNSAFFDKEDYADNVSQSDVYFTISYVLNRLRNSNKSHTLKQTMFVRNVIAPENLNRFNDGIIQASILRNAKEDELNYAIDDMLSLQMRDILITIFKYFREDQGEAIIEFLYAIASKKLKLKKKHLLSILDVLDENNKIIKFYKNVVKVNFE